MADAHEQPGGGAPLTPEEVERLTDHLASAARSGLPLAPGLRALGEELSVGGLRRSLIELADAIDRGSPLTAALEAQQGRIPAHIRGLVLGGLRTGKLGDALGRFSAYASVGAELKRGLWLGLAYPLCTLAMAFALIMLVEGVLVAQFENIFNDFGIALPKLTIVLVETSRLVRVGWPALAIVLGLIFAGWAGLRFLLPPPSRNSVMCRIPVIGPLWRYSSWAEFCHLLAILLESEVPMPEALRLTGQGVQNADVDRACRAMANQVERGETLADAMSGLPPTDKPTGPFDHLDPDRKGKPPELSLGDLLTAREAAAAVRRAMPVSLARLLKWAENHRAIAEILHMSGEMFEARSSSQAAFAGTVMSVLAVFGVILGVFAVVVGLMLPLITLISRLSG